MLGIIHLLVSNRMVERDGSNERGRYVGDGRDAPVRRAPRRDEEGI